jgi:hypothetical protein
MMAEQRGISGTDYNLRFAADSRVKRKSTKARALFVVETRCGYCAVVARVRRLAGLFMKPIVPRRSPRRRSRYILRQTTFSFPPEAARASHSVAPAAGQAVSSQRSSTLPSIAPWVFQTSENGRSKPQPTTTPVHSGRFAHGFVSFETGLDSPYTDTIP